MIYEFFKPRTNSKFSSKLHVLVQKLIIISSFIEINQ